MNSQKWERRIQRARELAAAYPFAADVLNFYASVARLQKALYISLKQRPPLDVARLAPEFGPFASGVEASAPAPIAQAAREWKAAGAQRVQELLGTCWQSDHAVADPETLLAWLLLQPYAEHLAEQTEPASNSHVPAVCPFCSRRPIAGALRPLGDGAKRSLICAMCSTEWPCGRLLCPACGEDDVDKLAIYTSEQFSHVRVEACDTCGCYIKTVDLSRNGLAVPVVDELATIPLNLWAQEHRYVKLQANILGI